MSSLILNTNCSGKSISTDSLYSSFGSLFILSIILEEKDLLTLKFLEIESNYLSFLKGFGIPEIKYYGHTEKYHILIETLLDKSLENLFSESYVNFYLKDRNLFIIKILFIGI